MHRFVVADDDGKFRVVTCTADGTAMVDVLQSLVDGYFEPIPGQVDSAGDDRHVVVWVNEIGRHRPDFGRNDQIAGVTAAPVALMGPAVVTVTDGHGDTVGLDTALLQAVRVLLAEAGGEELDNCDATAAATEMRDRRNRRQHPRSSS